MFSGIVTHTGKVINIYKKKSNCVLKIKSKIKFNKKEIGSSISCSGACLTLEEKNKNILKLKGHALLAYTIKAAINCKLFDRVYFPL